MSSIFNMPWTQAFDSAGNTLAGAKLYFYEAGTSTLQNVYADSELKTALSNPVIANGSGRFTPIYLADSRYKVALFTADDVEIWTADNIGATQDEEKATFATNAINKVITNTGLAQNIVNNFPYAVFKYANASTYYTDNGAEPNLYNLSEVGNYDNGASTYPYYTGFTARFVCTRPNTETSLVKVNVNGHGEKYIRRYDSQPLSAGEMCGLVTLVYNGVFFLLAGNNETNVGDIKASVLSATHNDWLLCDGRTVSRTDYPVLFSIIGENFGAGDGSTTFNLPDYRGKFLRGLGGDSADDVYTTQAEGLPNITGAAYGRAVVDGVFTAEGALYDNANYPGQQISDAYIETANSNQGISFDASRSNEIYGASEHVTPINMAVNYFIKAR